MEPGLKLLILVVTTFIALSIFALWIEYTYKINMHWSFYNAPHLSSGIGQNTKIPIDK